MRAPRRMAGAALALVASLSACEFDDTPVGQGRPRLAVHGVLDPWTGSTYEILVENTLTGRVTVDPDAVFDPEDPIVSGSGSPVSGATVMIRVYDDDGTTPLPWRTGVELSTLRSDGKGRGVYRFENRPPPTLGPPCPPCQPLIQGRRYDLRVTTPDARVATSTTWFPVVGAFQPDSADTVTFNREVQEYVFRWRHADYAYRYAVQVQSPWGPLEVFTDDTSMAFTGELRNLAAERLQRVFVPGFLQEVRVLSVDQNYFDYFRSFNSPFTGSGIINRVDGGIGVFGSVAAMRRVTLDVVATIDEPIEGRWRSLAPAGARALTLYVDAPTGFASGNLEETTTSRTRRGVLGGRTGTGLRLALLGGRLASDTIATFDASLSGDTLVTTRVRGVGLPELERWVREAP